MRMKRAVVEILRLAVARDRLDPAPVPSSEPPRASEGVLHVLFVSREPLGVEPEQRTRRSLLHALFAPEALPLDPELAPPARRRGRLAALLAPEKLDDAS